jgi:hypothetical protein
MVGISSAEAEPIQDFERLRCGILPKTSRFSLLINAHRGKKTSLRAPSAKKKSGLKDL